MLTSTQSARVFKHPRNLIRISFLAIPQLPHFLSLNSTPLHHVASAPPPFHAPWYARTLYRYHMGSFHSTLPRSCLHFWSRPTPACVGKREAGHLSRLYLVLTSVSRSPLAGPEKIRTPHSLSLTSPAHQSIRSRKPCNTCYLQPSNPPPALQRLPGNFYGPSLAWFNSGLGDPFHSSTLLSVFQCIDVQLLMPTLPAIFQYVRPLPAVPLPPAGFLPVGAGLPMTFIRISVGSPNVDMRAEERDWPPRSKAPCLDVGARSQASSSKDCSWGPHFDLISFPPVPGIRLPLPPSAMAFTAPNVSFLPCYCTSGLFRSYISSMLFMASVAANIGMCGEERGWPPLSEPISHGAGIVPALPLSRAVYLGLAGVIPVVLSPSLLFEAPVATSTGMHDQKEAGHLSLIGMS
ncbi:unnamed protein product [Peniophora sp. CBMAI 1063]|nr:unnamed protein product [Peniophora sp. CBMAI 1063]